MAVVAVVLVAAAVVIARTTEAHLVDQVDAAAASSASPVASPETGDRDRGGTPSIGGRAELRVRRRGPARRARVLVRPDLTAGDAARPR